MNNIKDNRNEHRIYAEIDRENSIKIKMRNNVQHK